ncbi:hypothetical protein O3M35_002300 [Rhynocoris fuscipes]|uniref:Uncharacterized protein n=1 Tax=Rhynocoris fuscipes TaxID=488301 RepID=A0AAW1CLN6_9HEMI
MMGLMDFASKFMPNMMNSPEGRGMIPNFPMNSNQFITGSDNEEEDDESSGSSEEEYKSKKRHKRRKVVKEDTLKKKRLQQKIKKSLEAHVQRLSGAMHAKSKEGELKKLPKLPARKKTGYAHRTVSEPQPPTMEPITNIATGGQQKSSAVRKESKEIQTKDTLPLNAIMDKEIETFKMKKENFICYLQNLQNEIKGLKIPERKLEQEEITKGNINEIGDGEKVELKENKSNDKEKPKEEDEKEKGKTSVAEEADIESNGRTDTKEKMRRKSKTISGRKVKEEKTGGDKSRRRRHHKKQTEPAYNGRLRIKGYKEAFLGNLDMNALMPKLEKLAIEKDVVPTVVKNQKFANYFKRIK